MPLLMLRPGPTRAPRRARPRARSLRSQTLFFAKTTSLEVLYSTMFIYFTHSNARLVFPLSDQLWTSISQGQVKIFKNYFFC